MEHDHHESDDFIEKIRPYFLAFEKSKRDKGLTQKALADHLSIRAASLSNLFRYYRGKTATPLNPGELSNIHRKLRSSTSIHNEYLTFNGAPDAEASAMAIHKNYNAAHIGKAIGESSDDEVCIINTYLSTILLNEELGRDHEETLENWLFVHQKRVRILLLEPNGKGMALRSKTDLDSNGPALANKILKQLSTLLSLEEKSNGRLQVKLMDEIPGVAGISTTNRLFFGLHFSQRHTEHGPWFEIIGDQHPSFLNFMEHFNTLWDDPNRSFKLSQENFTRYRNALSNIQYDRNFLVNTEWKVYLYDMNNVMMGKLAAPYEETIGEITEWELKITKPPRNVFLQAELKLPAKKEAMRARLITEKLNDRDYAHARFSDWEELAIHISFHCRIESIDNPFLLGYFTVSSGGDCCSGYLVLQDKSKPETDLPHYLKRLLIFRDSSYFSLQRIRSAMRSFEPFPFAGTYQTYAYGGKKKGDKMIKKNWLHIDEFGVARYRNQSYKNLYGRATLIDQKLHIVFTHIRENKKRSRRYMIVNMVGQPTKNQPFCTAINLAVSEIPLIPVSKRLILEYMPDTNFETTQPSTCNIHSKEFKSLDTSLRNLLSGRVENILGFLQREGRIRDFDDIEKEWKQSINLGQVFFDSALWNATQGNYSATAQLFRRAVQHGYDDLSHFEKQAQNISPEVLQQLQPTSDYQTAQNILKGPGTTPTTT
jgi:hypothetical protein